MPTDTITWSKRVGNVVSNILLGQTKEIIVRTDEGLRNLNKSVDEIKKELDVSIKVDLKDVRERFAALEGKASDLFKGQSPISLTSKGSQFLNNSGLKQYIDDNIERLVDTCSKNKNMVTAYDVQQASFDFFDRYNFPKEIENVLKTYAFNQGISMDIIRRIGAIYFRDLCLEKMNFRPEDLDT